MQQPIVPTPRVRQGGTPPVPMSLLRQLGVRQSGVRPSGAVAASPGSVP